MITFVIANRNRMKYIEKCIDSYCNFPGAKELIVVDSQSNDGSCEILEKYADILICENDESVYEAWNKAINASNGEWVYFLNSDDELLPAGFQKLNNELLYSEADILYGQVQVAKENNGKSIAHATSKVTFRQIISNPIYFNRFIFRRAIFERIGYFNENFKFVSDQDFIWRCLDRRMNFQYVKADIYKYQMHNESLTLNNQTYLFKDELEVAKSNFEKSISLKGRRYAGIWVQWELESLKNDSKFARFLSRLLNPKLFYQQLFSIYLKIVHQ